jgi:RHS repeat-associated protein
MSSKVTRRIKVIRLSIALIVLAAIRLTASAQAPQSQYDRGTPPQHTAGVSAIGSYISADIGTINLSNGSLNFRLPVGNVGGRGFWLPLTLNYSSKVWSGSRGQVFVPDEGPGSQPDTTGHNAAIAFASYDDRGAGPYNGITPGWTVGAAPFLKARGVGIGPHDVPAQGCKNFDWVVVKLTLVLPDKGEIELRDEPYNGAPINPTTGSDGCHSQDGASHGRRWHSTDGSGIVFINDNNNGVLNGDLAGVVITAEGTRYHFVNTTSGTPPPSAYVNSIGLCDWVRDRNGNKVVIQYPTSTRVEYIDQLGRMTTVESNVSDPQAPFGPLALLVTLPGYGQVHYYKVKTGLMNQNYRSDLNIATPVRVGGDPGGGTVLFLLGYAGVDDRIDDISVLTQLILPDNRALTFKYNEFGELAEVQMPTGGKVQYDYGGMAYSAPLQRGLPSGNSLDVEVVATGVGGGGNVHAVDRAMVTRRTYPNGDTSNPPEGSWTYDYKIDKTEVKCTAASTTLLDEWHYFLAAQRFLTGSTANGADGTGYSLWSTGVEHRSEMVNGAAVLSATEQDSLQRITIQSEEKWTTGHSIEEVANDNRVTQTRKYLDDGSFSKADTSYDQTLGDNNHVNNPIQVDEYDFDHTTLKRRSTTSYFTGGNYTGTGVNTLNLLGLPLEQAVYEPTDLVNPKSRTTYEYDNYMTDGSNNHAALQSYSPDAINHDSGFEFNYATRGNPTQITRMVNSSTSVISYPRYDTLGNVVSTKDPRTYVTTISYTDDFGNGSNPGFGGSGTFGPTYSLPTLITSPLPNAGEPAHTARSQYDFSTGLPTGFKDRNGIITQSIYNDTFDRLTQIKAALGTPAENHTAMYYAPQTNPFPGITLTNNDVLTAKDQVSLNDGNLRSWTKTDGFGRTIEGWTHAPDELYQGNPVSGDIVVKTNYDGLGRTKQTSNPFRPAVLTETAQYTETTYDLAGRAIGVTTLTDNATVSTAYDGPRVLVKDQAGKERLSKTDGLGRLTDIWEIRSNDAVTGTEPVTFPNHSEVQGGYRTKYSYDALDDLTQTAQQIGMTGTTQTRTFGYDGLKRLINAFNPENATVSYTYDDNSNLHTKIDSRVPAVTTTYEYDALNRVKSRSYSDSTLAVAYKYDAQQLPPGAPGTSDFDRGYSTGQLVAVNYGGTSAGNYTGYDRLGRANVSVQQTDSQNYRFTYGYNLATEMTTESYPSGRAITTGYDVAGRILQLGGTKTGEQPRTYASQFTYSAHGAVVAMQLGNNKWEHTSFNTRLQPTLIGLGTSSSDSSILRLDYGYGTTTNNGNVLTQTITAPQIPSGNLVLTQTYTYDALNRLLTAGENGSPSWSQSYSYDRYGNRWVAGYIVPGNESLTPQSANAFIATTNRIDPAVMGGFGYDAAGNLTSDPRTPPNGIVYDAENRQTRFNGSVGQYFYDGDGRRVKKIDNTGTTVFVYNAGGQLIAEYTSGPPSGGGTSYLTSDHLGSTRVVMKSDGSVARHDFLPFGEEISSAIGGRGSVAGYGAADTTRQKFTQKERDNESGLDYFGARYYSSAQGRFTSPDEFSGGPDELYDFAASASDNPTFYADLHEPQSLNKYQYCYNNPLACVDPDGHQNSPFESAKVRAKAYGKAIGDCAGNAGIGVLKSVGNVFVGIINLMVGPEVGFKGEPVAPYQENGDCQGVAMHATDVGLLLTPLAGKAPPIGVMTAEAEETAVVVAETANTGKGSLVRFGPGPENAKQLGADAAAAEAKGLPHGVSTKLVDRVSGTDKAHRSAPRTEVENHFRVEQTGNNPKHHTVHLPKPVTSQTADKFNKVFKPKEVK